MGGPRNSGLMRLFLRMLYPIVWWIWGEKIWDKSCFVIFFGDGYKELRSYHLFQVIWRRFLKIKTIGNTINTMDGAVTEQLAVALSVAGRSPYRINICKVYRGSSSGSGCLSKWIQMLKTHLWYTKILEG